MNPLDGAEVNPRYDALLAPYAVRNAQAIGRKYPEPPDPLRTPFQRDRDRIIHANAWRRLKGKTQVVSPEHGDHFRTRMTHTLEVASMARDLARVLRLNEDLCEAIALGHDLGHTPFGHCGEETLNACLEPYGAVFEHNAHSLRIVTVTESPYASFPGLNLTHEVLQGLQKHNTFFDQPNAKPSFTPHLEAQLVDVADEIAYLSADLEDGLRGGFFRWEDACALPLVQNATASAPSVPGARPSRVRAVVRFLLLSLVDSTQENLQKSEIKTLLDVQKTKAKIVQWDPVLRAEITALKDFLMREYYLAPAVKTNTETGRKIITDLFAYYRENPSLIPNPHGLEWYRAAADYIAGMTDRFAISAWREYATPR